MDVHTRYYVSEEMWTEEGTSMNVTDRDIDVLLELQAVDIDMMKAKKQRDDLPQKAKINLLQEKLEVLSEKLESVLTLQDKAQSDLDKVETEDNTLAEKQRKAQELINVAGSDYRSIESHSKELSGFAKRRDTLSEKIETLTTHLEKVAAVRGQLETAISQVEMQREAAQGDFDVADGALAQQIDSLMDKRNALSTELSRDLVTLYEKTAARTGGVALGRLNENTCGVCRSAIEGGRLIELRASAPLGVCPSCKRLLVIE